MKGRVVFVALLCGLAFLLGCQGTTTTEIPPPPPPPHFDGYIQLIMWTDTLHGLSQDSCSIPGFVSVRDDGGRSYQGAVVDLSLTDSTAGSLEYASDTTDEHGRVYFVFYAANREALDSTTIIARKLDQEARWTLWIKRQMPGFLRVFVQPDTVRALNPAQESVLVTATLADTAFNPIPDVLISFAAAGHLDSVRATDQNGSTSTSWIPGGIGTFWITAHMGAFRDSARVTLDTIDHSAVGSLTVRLAAHQFYFWPGDSIAVQGFAVLRNVGGYAMPGHYIGFTLSDSLGRLAYPNPRPGDTTDSGGRVEFQYDRTHLAGMSRDTVSAVSEGLSAADMVVFSPRSHVPAELHLTATPDTVHRRGAPWDTVRVTATVLDSAHVGISGINLGVSTSTGYVMAVPPTDAAGTTTGLWYFAASGRFFVTARVWVLADTAWISVDSLSGGS
jgi:hypothetical protein